MPAAPNASAIILDTLGKLHERGYGMFGTCLDCARLYRMDAPAKERISACFDIDLEKLIGERGADATCIRMPPIHCPRCGSDRTEYRITTGRGYRHQPTSEAFDVPRQLIQPDCQLRTGVLQLIGEEGVARTLYVARHADLAL
jgi:hypothetical protein